MGYKFSVLSSQCILFKGLNHPVHLKEMKTPGFQPDI